jgi:hypothetical protein
VEVEEDEEEEEGGNGAFASSSTKDEDFGLFLVVESGSRLSSVVLFGCTFSRPCL